MSSSRPIHDIEVKWQKTWEEEGIYKAADPSLSAKRYPLNAKYYGLIEFPFLSGDGLHVGHVRSYTAIDILTRKKRMEGKNVLYPIGWDAFGLPTENFAIKFKMKPTDVTKKNIATFMRQLKSIGLGFDWSREVSTADPTYYKWTQWQFLQFFKAGLAYKAKSIINWCPRCKIGLANEEAQGGVCERCGNPVEKREKEQWMIGITKYAERLLKDLDTVDYLNKIKTQQVNWIGKSEGMLFTAPVKDMDLTIQTFSAHFESCYADTFVVIAPDHPLLFRLLEGIPDREGILDQAQQMAIRRMQERGEAKEVEGIFTGRYMVDPLGNGDLPIWVANFALADYGTGIVKCSAHDERDFAFAKKYGIRLKPVLFPSDSKRRKRVERLEECFTDMKEGILSEPTEFAGRKAGDVHQNMMQHLVDCGFAVPKTTYRLRDWVFSRQRYWGEPIPLVYCENCAKKKQKVLIIHGFTGRADKNWMPWIKPRLEQDGFEVFIPIMTTTDHPVLEKWLEELAPFVERLGEDDVIVGYSLGGKAALHILERLNKKIGHLFLIAPAIAPVTEEDIEKKKKKRPGRDYGSIIDFWNKPLDWNKIKKNITNAQVIFSDDDESVRPVGHDVIPPSWYIETLHGYHHFTDNKEIPILFDIISRSKNTGWVPLRDQELPLKLPEVEAYEPTDTGESPLAKIKDWVNTTCPRCGGPATRETDTMPNWAGSSWYFLRYCDPHNDQEFASAEKLKYWMPVDLYNGGMEHTTLHLLYSRFWYKFLWDMGYIPHECGPEPYRARRSHGLILAQGGEKMSKSKGNVINPDDIVSKYGADVFRVYEMFMGPFDQPVPWDTNGIEGVKRFLDRVYSVFSIQYSVSDIPNTQYSILNILYHQTVKKITEGIDQLQFNTCVSQLMILTNAFGSPPAGGGVGGGGSGGIPETMRDGFLKLLAPFAPHLAEEIWRVQLGHKDSIHRASWPTYDPSKLQAATFELVIQVNGKVRDRITVSSDISEEEAKDVALKSEKVIMWLMWKGKYKEPKKIVYVSGKLISIVV